jgi:DNA invertase Pin-like site-specific DNA recombinase
MLIGYMRVSKNDRSQTLDLQRDALIAAGIFVVKIHGQQAKEAYNNSQPFWQNHLRRFLNEYCA